MRALRKRIERGQLRAVQHGRYWKIPHAELERLAAETRAAEAMSTAEKLRAAERAFASAGFFERRQMLRELRRRRQPA